MSRTSIVIPTFNSSISLPNCLRSIARQNTPSEVLVIDRFSDDGTEKIAASFGAVVIRSAGNRSVARNVGLENSTLPNVIFIDSDMILPESLVTECEEGLQRFDALIIPELSVGKGYWARCKSLERQTLRGTDLLEAARAFRKNALLNLGGFDPLLEAGEDWDLQHRAQFAAFSIGRVRSEIVHDEGDLKLLSLLRKKYRYGRTIGTYLKKNPSIGLRQVSPFRRIVQPGLTVMSRNPEYGIGIIVGKTLEYVAAGLGQLDGKFRQLDTCTK